MAIVLNPPTGKGLLGGPVRIDWSHPLATGLIGCWVPGVSFGINLAGKGADLSPDATLATTFATGVTQDGPAHNSNGLNSGLDAKCTAQFFDYTNGQTIFWRGLSIAAPSARAVAIGVLNDITNPTVAMSSLQFSGGNQPLLYWNNAGTQTNGGAGGLLMTFGAMYSLAGTFAVGGNSVLYVYGPSAANGVQDTTAFGASAPSGATANVCVMFNSQANVFQNPKVACNIGCIWNRVLSAQEIAALNDDPYQFLIPVEGEMPALRSAAAPTVPVAGWQQLPAIAPKVAIAFPTQASGFSVPPTIVAPTAVPAGWQQPTSIAPKVARAFPTQPTGFSVPPPIAVVSGTLATTELTDVASFTVSYTAPPVFIPVLQDASVPGYRTVYYKALVNVYPPLGIAGILATTEAQDVAAFNATFAITGILATTEGQDTASFTGSGVAPSGTLAVTEAPDTAAFAGNFVASGTLAVTEAQDVGAFNGTVSLPASGTLAVTEAPDVASFTGTAIGLPVGILATIELPDNVIILADYQPSPTTTAPSPYPSRYDYGWYDRKKVRKR